MYAARQRVFAFLAGVVLAYLGLVEIVKRRLLRRLGP
jgi:hypothetical protein